mmetsp:Transcript_39447/g.63094  ORF Transcript_39447/g.63094 Transcript_39447/m.63094 type:complete len:202 (-) Transcript_39447:473-1078(-)
MTMTMRCWRSTRKNQSLWRRQLRLIKMTTTKTMHWIPLMKRKRTRITIINQRCQRRWHSMMMKRRMCRKMAMCCQPPWHLKKTPMMRTMTRSHWLPPWRLMMRRKREKEEEEVLIIEQTYYLPPWLLTEMMKRMRMIKLDRIKPTMYCQQPWRLKRKKTTRINQLRCQQRWHLKRKRKKNRRNQRLCRRLLPLMLRRMDQS